MKVTYIVLLACVLAVAQAATPGQAAADAGMPSPDAFAAAAPTAGDVSGPLGAVPDPLSLGASPPGMAGDTGSPNTLPPYNMMQSDMTVSPNLAKSKMPGLKLDIDRRIKQAEDLLNRMVWQLNRETSWANSVHDIIQNYQYKYTKVLSNIKKHSGSTQKMRKLLTELKRARLHEILESHLQLATDELTELSASSSAAGGDEGSYSSLKDRAALIKQDLEKMAHKSVNKVLHGVQDKIKEAANDAVPPPSSDTLKGLSLSSAGQ